MARPLSSTCGSTRMRKAMMLRSAPPKRPVRRYHNRGVELLKRESDIDFRLSSNDVIVLDEHGSVVWEGVRFRMAFLFRFQQMRSRSASWQRLYLSAVSRFARLYFILRPDGKPTQKLNVSSALLLHTHSKIRVRYWSRIQRMQSVAPWLHVFDDTADLHVAASSLNYGLPLKRVSGSIFSGLSLPVSLSG